jgi:glycosyltransferase involved in cell wall biosynthesis
LLFTDWYLPGFKGGGPIQSIAGMVEKLTEDVAFYIITRDRDLGDSRPYTTIVSGSWNEVGQARVFYWPLGLIGKLSLLKEIRKIEYNFIYLNGIFSLASTILPLLCIRFKLIKRAPIIIAPRGELSLGALSIKPIKKKLFLAFARYLGLYKDVVWHASSVLERNEIIFHFEKSSREVMIAPNLYPRSRLVVGSVRKKKSGEVDLVTLSRISRKKNIHFTLKLLLEIEGNVNLDIYGPCEDIQYWQNCLEVMGRLKANIAVCYKGEILHEDVIHTLANYDFFIFPTLGENYGHVIREALAAGLPLIISDQTPWRNLYDIGVGWDLPLSDPYGFIEVINKCIGFNEDEYRELSVNALRFADKIGEDSNILEANQAIFANR